MLRFFVLLISCASLLGGCESGPTKWDETPSSSRIGDGDHVRWKTTPLTDGSADIYLAIDGKPYLIEKGARNFAKMMPDEYENKGVPTEAMAAAYFWADSAHEEDAQKIYVMKEASQILVYSGYAVPGSNHDTQWQVKRTISF
ncbi:MAG: hypothetical protein ACI8T1_004823 [Verrucomicrobiales bacterium]|jgi:hypothetical protein